MNVLVLGTSPCGAASATFALAKRLVDHVFPSTDCRVLHLADLALPACDGRLDCVTREAAQARAIAALAPVYDAMKSADVVVFAAPVHNFTVPALLKNLIDLMVFESHRPSFMGRSALIVATAMGAGQDRVFRYFGDVVKSWGFRLVGRLGANTSVIDEPWYEARLVAALDTLRRRVPQAIADPRPRVGLYDLTAFRIWKLVVELNPDKSPVDHRHWAQTGLVDARYYYPCRTRLVARGLSALIVRLVRHGIVARKLKPML